MQADSDRDSPAPCNPLRNRASGTAQPASARTKRNGAEGVAMSRPSRYSPRMHSAIAIPIFVATMTVMAGFAARVACSADRAPMGRSVHAATAQHRNRGDRR